MKQKIIKEYIRNPDTKQPRGIAVAVRDNDEVLYGYSLLNLKLDKFNKELGLTIALNRALSKDGYNLPDTLEREAIVLGAFNRLESRCLKYFKDLDPDKVKLMPSNIESRYTEELFE